jgi:hypothetical protein
MPLVTLRCFVYDMQAAQKAYEEVCRYHSEFPAWENQSQDFRDSWHAAWKDMRLKSLRGEA